MKLYKALLPILCYSFMIFCTQCKTPALIVGENLSSSPTTIVGFNHIGLSVKNLDSMVKFYQDAAGYELMNRETIKSNKTADKLFGRKDISYERVTLEAPNMRLELTQYDNQKNSKTTRMHPKGPGMTHTCYQSVSWNSGYDKFVKAGVDMLSRGTEPVDLGGYGVTYAYAYDPEGNMVELEQLDTVIIKGSNINMDWIDKNEMWMTQVAIMSPDLLKLQNFYQMVLAFKPSRTGSYADRPRFDDIIDMNGMAFDAAWFNMDKPNKMLELMQYRNPATPAISGSKEPTDLGYTFSLEVADIKKEYKRLKKSGVQFISAPQELGDYKEVFARDVDGNIFSLREPLEEELKLSISNFKNQ